MRRPGGEVHVSDPEGPDTRFDTFTCNHCNTVVFVKPMQDPSELGGFCRMCMRHICGPCTAHAGCIPFEKKLDAMERRERLRRSCG
jgi:hypothetical protein